MVGFVSGRSLPKPLPIPIQHTILEAIEVDLIERVVKFAFFHEAILQKP